MIKNIPFLGVGVGFRTQFKQDLFQNTGSVDFLEITADHFMFADKYKLRELDLLREQFCLIPHGLDLSLGSACGLDKHYAAEFAKLIKRLNPPYWSEHIAFTKHENINIGHLSPVIFSRESLQIFQKNIAEMQKMTDTPLILENITVPFYFPQSEMSESEFIQLLLEQNDCGMLLDVTNVYTNAYNHNFSAENFIRNLPHARIVQMHLAGGYMLSGGLLIDSHSNSIAKEVWELTKTALELCAPKGVIIERDENIPPFAELMKEVEFAKKLLKNTTG
jgi:uncharacterized protein (UPF0276 family)